MFQAEHGPLGSPPAFEAARRNFLISEVRLPYPALAKDCHNGNLLVDSEGHLVHIDFGFILEISPGGNMQPWRPASKSLCHAAAAASPLPPSPLPPLHCSCHLPPRTADASSPPSAAARFPPSLLLCSVMP